MSEPQYKDYDKLPRRSLGLMSNEIWHRDPKMLGIHLARYKFVAKMLAGKERVAEVGCGDGFYSHIVREECSPLLGVNIYDFDESFIKEYRYKNPSLATYAHVHNILNSPLPDGKFEAIYSLDVMEHIHWYKDQDTYLKNIKDSLTDKGVFIVGMPSLESQRYASEASKIGHVGCLSGDDLKQKLHEFFPNVFLFSMHDETISTAFSPMAHYLMAVCVC